MRRKITITIDTTTLPATINGAAQEASPGNYAVFINSDKTDQEQAAAFLHEMLHIYHNGFASTERADKIERDRHGELLKLLEMLEQEATR